MEWTRLNGSVYRSLSNILMLVVDGNSVPQMQKKVKVKSLSHVRLSVAPCTVAHQAPLSMRDFPGKNTGVGCHFLLQGIFLTQGSNPGLQHCRQTLLSEPPGKPTGEQDVNNGKAGCAGGEGTQEPSCTNFLLNRSKHKDTRKTVLRGTRRVESRHTNHVLPSSSPAGWGRGAAGRFWPPQGTRCAEWGCPPVPFRPEALPTTCCPWHLPLGTCR